MAEKSSKRSTPATARHECAGKVALVTGSTSGIGQGIAEAFAAAGMSVVLNGSGVREGSESLREQMAARHGVPVHFMAADMARPEEIGRLIQDTETRLGRIDVLVNNAGIQHVAPIETFPAEKWDAILAINLSSAFHTIRAALPGMKARGWGRIINVASAHSLVASPFKSAYVAAKHGLLGLTRTVALEVAENAITVNAICPGYVLTPLVEKQIPDTAKARNITKEQVIKDVLLKAQPTRQFVTTEQVGALALFLCTSSAASITGTALPVDGGWTAQ